MPLISSLDHNNRSMVIATPKTAAAAATKSKAPPALSIHQTVSQDEDSEESPEPSPVGPPAPQEHRPKSAVVPPLPTVKSTPPSRRPLASSSPKQQVTRTSTTFFSKENSAVVRNASTDDNASVNSFSVSMEAPSPYSPPSSSLFSGEEWPPKSQRKSSLHPPLREVQMTMSEDMENNKQLGQPNSQAVDLSAALLSALLSSSSSTMMMAPDRSHLLPAVLNLKKDLQKSHQSLFLLQEENKALAAECDRFQAQLSQWHQSASLEQERTAALQETVEQLSIQTDELKLEKEALEHKVQLLVETNRTVQEELAESRKQNEEFASIRKSLEESLSGHQKEMDQLSHDLLVSKAKTAALDEQRRSWDREKDSLQAEVRELRSKLKEEALEGSNKFKKAKQDMESKIKRLEDENASHLLSMDRFKAMLKEADKRVSKISLDSEATESRLRKEVERLEQARDRLMEENETLHKTTDRLDKLLVEQSAESCDQVKQIANRYESNLKTLQDENSSLKLQLEKLEIAVKEKEQGQFALASESDQRVRKLEKEIRIRQSALLEEKTMSSDLREEISVLKAQVKSLEQELSVPVLRPKTTDAAVQTASQQSMIAQNASGNSNASVSDKIARIRDAAERAALVQEHRRELSRLEAAHQSELKRLAALHGENMKNASERAASELTTRVKDCERQLEHKYDAKLAELDKKYQAELNKTRDECDKLSTVAKEMMQAAIKEVENEAMAREQLQNLIRDMELRLHAAMEERVSMHEVEMQRREWQEETQQLLASIQNECNAIFDSNKTKSVRLETLRSSPRSVTATFNSVMGDDKFLDDEELSQLNGLDILEATAPLATSTNPPSSVALSHAFDPYEVNRVLDETEALVRSLVGDE